MSDIKDARKKLKEVFGYDSFRMGQEPIISSILSGADTLAIMPTGGGKSICCQIPALLFPGVTVVISPLISLMEDQVCSLKKRGIQAAYISSSLSENEKNAVLSALSQGILKLIYASPERLNTPKFLQAVSRVHISFVAVDEAHCASMWGKEFRPAYRDIPGFLSALPSRPVLAALTASADTAIKNDILDLLGFESPNVFVFGFDRPNLFYEVLKPKKKWETLLSLLASYRGQCGIIYCLTRKTCETLVTRLATQGISSLAYHGGMEAGQRAENQSRWTKGEVRLIVATNAFGMGIDKPDVRYVIHYNMPGDLESYYQEAGRAGRDGRPSDCILLYSPKDLRINRFFISHTQSEELKKIQIKNLRDMQYFVSGNECLRHVMLDHFGEHSPAFCGKCSVCISESGLHSAKKSSSPYSAKKHIPAEDPDLFLELRSLRLRLARLRGCLPYQIISDETLHDLARIRPETPADFLFLEGAGLIKTIKYGADFLTEIRAWNRSHPY